MVQQGLASIIESAVPQTHLLQYGILACFVSVAPKAGIVMDFKFYLLEHEAEL